MIQVLKQALSQYGITEEPGEASNNPEIMKYFESIEQHWVKNDETAWCSAFVNWCAKEAGYEYSDKLTARSWLHTGHRVEDPEPGDIIVLWRDKPDSWKGHVGLYITNDKNWVYILGGNQSNKVCIKAYYMDRVLQVRRLNKANVNS